mmetsp:Transcript_10012/g.14996  ORF Transcript_10012/g.14996 Transcript_10012/m.14996 type:complete len:410 (-) Transcript_10012:287-1516(-)|eukprot:CAMPEP_0203670506 /NCGR_PEP_ID=MMETSP0090-20130426/6555_1 /ASSEMBLY_ACC=CAM_ASM_001088 /TAXON_ID=426623 /ORGANISM="Chaetoceros affinis, Strain CCMP159" /LENGTH=409 /DNA_ID=CAMNT_0050535377 /DNA_START=104 /DNA_END=1333 /DNA_ORIENTATION=+
MINANDSKPNKLFVNAALMSAQIIFGISAVVGTIGLPSFHPLTFALVRESNATILLLLASHVVSKAVGRSGGLFSGSFKKDWKIIFVSGLGIFMSQAFYIVGIKLSTAVAASVWQPSQPIITAAVCMLLGWEPFNMKRVIGILIAFLGCSIMVLGGSGTATGESLGGDAEGISGAFPNLMGQVSFFVNCLGSSLYVLASKRVIATGRYESVTVTAWSYLAATFMMGIFALTMSLSETLSSFICSDCEKGIWHVPSSAIPALIWYILMTSSTAYGLITWANKYASGTLVIGYTVLQPMASAVLIQMLITFGVNESCSVVEGARSILRERLMEEITEPCLDEPDKYTAMGALGVVTGLFVIIWTEPKDANSSLHKEGESTKEEVELTGFLDEHFLYDSDDDDLRSLEGQDL